MNSECLRCGKELPKGVSPFEFSLTLRSDKNVVLAMGIDFNHRAIGEGSRPTEVFIQSGTECEYSLCEECHKEFLSIVGSFLKQSPKPCPVCGVSVRLIELEETFLKKCPNCESLINGKTVRFKNSGTRFEETAKG